MNATISFEPVYSVYLPPVVSGNGLIKSVAIHQCYTYAIEEAQWSDGIRAAWPLSSPELEDGMMTARWNVQLGKKKA